MRETFKGLPKALADTEPGDRVRIIGSNVTATTRWNPEREAGLLDANLLLAEKDLQMMHRQLNPDVSQPAKPQLTDFPPLRLPLEDIDLPVGSIDIQAFRAEQIPWTQHTLGNVVRLYHFAEQNPKHPLVEESLGRLREALNGVPGRTVWARTLNLCHQLEVYEEDSLHSREWMQSEYNLLPESRLREGYNLLQFNIPLSREWRRE